MIFPQLTNPRVRLTKSITGPDIGQVNATVNLATLPGYRAGVTDLYLTVEAGAYIRGIGTGHDSLRALKITAPVPGNRVFLDVAGTVAGWGGKGGYSRNDGAWIDPTAGGDAILLDNVALFVQTIGTGFIGGGGGGGGGAFVPDFGTPNAFDFFNFAPMAGGGGGAGWGVGGDPSSISPAGGALGGAGGFPSGNDAFVNGTNYSGGGGGGGLSPTGGGQIRSGVTNTGAAGTGGKGGTCGGSGGTGINFHKVAAGGGGGWGSKGGDGYVLLNGAGGTPVGGTGGVMGGGGDGFFLSPTATAYKCQSGGRAGGAFFLANESSVQIINGSGFFIVGPTYFGIP